MSSRRKTKSSSPRETGSFRVLSPANFPSNTSRFNFRQAWRRKWMSNRAPAPMPNFISEDQIERALVQKLQQLHGFDSLNCHTKDPEDINDRSGRANKSDVILLDRVREAAIRLNPTIPLQALENSLEKL